jgi:hypothetical protein
VDDAMMPTPAGVGVKGGGLMGDSSVALALRFFGRGVAGRLGTVSFASSDVALDSSCDTGAVALALRFLGAAAGFATLVYFATPFVALASTGRTVLVVATRAERLKDMLKCLLWSRRVLFVKEA